MAAPNILVIDDEDALRGELVELLCALGAAAIGVADGPGASAACCTCRFDLVLCDYKLRIDNGLQVLRSLVAACGAGNTPDMYLMTGHLDLTLAARAEIAASTQGLLMKPISVATLRQLVVDAGARTC